MRRFLHLCLMSASVMFLATSCFPRLLISEVTVPEVSASSESSSVSSASSSAGTPSSVGSTSVSVETKNSRVSVVTDTSRTVVTRSKLSESVGACDSLTVSVASGRADIIGPGYTAECNCPENKTSGLQRQLSYTLKFGKREMSGIILAKPLADGSYRALGTTIFGMTVFDMTVSKDSYTMNSCAEFLENKAFASFLAGKIRKALY